MKINKKILIPIVLCFLMVYFFFILIAGVVAGVFGKYSYEQQAINKKSEVSVINSQLYADKYKTLLNDHLLNDGYVSLERLVFYLQRTNNILDTSTLELGTWREAYLNNLDKDEKQMIPIKTICKNLKEDVSIPTFTQESGLNKDGFQIDVINLCMVDEIDITESDDYDELIYPQPFTFPIHRYFTISSFVFEHRNVELGLSPEEQARVNNHSGWDISVPIGTEFYSICDGVVSNMVYTQIADVPYNVSHNDTGNYISVQCNNGLVVTYAHIQHSSNPIGIIKGSLVNKGELLGKTSTTGLSTGGHLHLGLTDEKGKLLDAFDYIDFSNID